MIERTTVRLPSELLDRARRKAADEGRTLTALIEDGLRLVVVAKRCAAGNERLPIPVSLATGGPLPGIELDDTSKIEEMDDVYHVARVDLSG